jgi:hypothetical protein
MCLVAGQFWQKCGILLQLAIAGIHRALCKGPLLQLLSDVRYLKPNQTNVHYRLGYLLMSPSIETEPKNLFWIDH